MFGSGTSVADRVTAAGQLGAAVTVRRVCSVSGSMVGTALVPFPSRLVMSSWIFMAMRTARNR